MTEEREEGHCHSTAAPPSHIEIQYLANANSSELRGFSMFNVQCGPMTNKEYQIFPAGSATVDIELTFS